MPDRTSGAVVVVGSLHYDIMVDAPDRPRKGETVAGFAWRPKFGGKGGNQAVAAARAGALTRMAGVVGNDGFGNFLLAGLDAAGVDRTNVAVIDAAGSGMSVAISDAEGDYGAVIVSGANLLIPAALVEAQSLWHDARVLVLQNEVTEATNLVAARAARRADALVCLNAAPARPLVGELATLVDILVVNAVEAEMLSGVVVDSLDSARRAAAALRPPDGTAIVTAGGAGVAAAAHDGEVALPAIPVNVASTHGAGDTFVGVLAEGIGADLSLDEALTRANQAAAAHVSGH
jgi:ribokinase